MLLLNDWDMMGQYRRKGYWFKAFYNDDIVVLEFYYGRWIYPFLAGRNTRSGEVIYKVRITIDNQFFKI